MKKHLEERRYLVPFDSRRLPHIFTDVLVIGAGVAGLRAAIAAAEHGSVTVLAKRKLAESSTAQAQGGIAVAMAPGDSVELLVADTLATGSGLCDEETVRVVVGEGPARVKELIEWGTPFDRENGHIAFTLEGGHSHHRVIHADGDATGRAIENSLIQKVRPLPNVSILENHYAVDLLHKDGVCYGVIVLDVKSGKFLKIEAKATVLATGGLGQIYRETTGPEVTTGDGIAMAFRAGATGQDVDFESRNPDRPAWQDYPLRSGRFWRRPAQ
jgi:L-aspartate oxidase